MTEPTRRPITTQAVAGFAVAVAAWCCRCQVHWATTAQPLCPSCLDDRAREIREKK